MTLLSYFTMLPAMLGMWLEMDIVIFAIKKAVHLFRTVVK